MQIKILKLQVPKTTTTAHKKHIYIKTRNKRRTKNGYKYMKAYRKIIDIRKRKTKTKIISKTTK